MKRFLTFGIIGAAGFVVDSAVLLFGMHVLGLDKYSARVFSYLVAATVTWIGNRKLTFADRPKAPRRKQWLKFLIVNLGGFAINYGTYAALVASVPFVGANPVLGVAAGAITGMFFNYFVSNRYVFRV